MSRIERYKKAKIIGPGTWYVGHLLCEKAAESKDPKDFDLAYGFIQKIKMYFVCGKCRSHLNEYAMSNNPERFLDIKDAEGLADWWFDAHNNANQIINNPSEDRQAIKNFFRTSEGSCDLNCDTEEVENVNIIKISSANLYTPIKGNFKSTFLNIKR